ncbi:MAG TPA: histone deacetylase [Tepidisphaeraceae bacterium]|nr:histone deacetylase [Tepidisphaeraceae bacterium]
MVGYCSSVEFAKHLTGPGHPERPDRIRAIDRAVRLAGLLDGPGEFPDFEIDLRPLPAAKGKMVELSPTAVDEPTLRWIHSQRYIEHVWHICAGGGGMLDEGDTVVGHESFDIAKLSTGAVLKVCDAVIEGTIKRGFAAVRPPGHHALPDHAMGFCIFANVAIAARYLQRKHGIGKVAIVDFDVHHGNGTQACLDSDPTVLFVSLHQDPRTLWPGSGYAEEIGTGAGRGFTLNIPLPPGGDNATYLQAIRETVIPRIEDFQPEILLISAGFDAHRDDPLAQMCVSEEGFGEMTRQLCAVADRCCGGRVVSALEGGYNLRALGRSVVQHLLAMGES